MDLASLRRTNKNRRLVFVGHSLGGILIKQALIRSAEYFNNKQDMNLGAISQATSGVIFLGTPHRGSGKTSLGSLVQIAAKIALRQPNTKLLDVLCDDSQILEMQQKSFNGICRDWTLACLHEEYPESIGIVHDLIQLHNCNAG